MGRKNKNGRSRPHVNKYINQKGRLLRKQSNSYCLALVEENGERAVYPFALSTIYGVDLRATVIPIRRCPRCGKRLRPHMEEGDTGTLYYTCNRCGHREESWLDAEELDKPEESCGSFLEEDEIYE